MRHKKQDSVLCCVNFGVTTDSKQQSLLPLDWSCCCCCCCLLLLMVSLDGARIVLANSIAVFRRCLSFAIFTHLASLLSQPFSHSYYHCNCCYYYCLSCAEYMTRRACVHLTKISYKTFYLSQNSYIKIIVTCPLFFFQADSMDGCAGGDFRLKWISSDGPLPSFLLFLLFRKQATIQSVVPYKREEAGGGGDARPQIKMRMRGRKSLISVEITPACVY